MNALNLCSVEMYGWRVGRLAKNILNTQNSDLHRLNTCLLDPLLIKEFNPV